MTGGRRPVPDDSGFTLVELLVAIVIIGVITIPLCGSVLGYLTNTGTTTTRLAQSHDLQMVSAYLAQDAESLGMRDYTQSPPAPVQSVWNSGFPANSCGSASGNQVLLVGWDDFSTVAQGSFTATVTPRQLYAAYVVEPDGQLHRIRCTGATAGDLPLTRNLQGATAGCPAACGTAFPDTVTLTLTIQGFDNQITLTGQRRQDHG